MLPTLTCEARTTVYIPTNLPSHMCIPSHAHTRLASGAYYVTGDLSLKKAYIPPHNRVRISAEFIYSKSQLVTTSTKCGEWHFNLFSPRFRRAISKFVIALARDPTAFLLHFSISFIMSLSTCLCQSSCCFLSWCPMGIVCA